MSKMILFCKENIKSIKMFGKDMQVVNNLSLDSGMMGHLNFLFYWLCKCSNFPLKYINFI